MLIENVRSHSFVGASLAVGSETSGGIRNVTVRQFHVEGTELGLSVKTERGRGGVIEDLTFEHVTIQGSGCAALELSEQYHRGIPVGNSTTTPIIRRVIFRDIVATNIVSHPGFCVPLGSSIDDTVASTATMAPAVGSRSLAIFKGIGESPLQNVELERVQLSGSVPRVAAVQCENATVHSQQLVVDGRPWGSAIVCDQS